VTREKVGERRDWRKEQKIQTPSSKLQDPEKIQYSSPNAGDCRSRAIKLAGRFDVWSLDLGVWIWALPPLCGGHFPLVDAVAGRNRLP
jgi:hypothetical protein